MDTSNSILTIRTITKFIVVLTISLVGCSFPKQEARAKARVLREKGQESEARRLEEKSKREPDIGIGSDYDPRDDVYHFPELNVPQEKRKYAIRISTSNSSPALERGIRDGQGIPFHVLYDFQKSSEIQNPKLVEVKRIKANQSADGPQFYFDVVNHSTYPVTLKGEVTFYDSDGQSFWWYGKLGELTPKILEGIPPGSSEQLAFPSGRTTPDDLEIGILPDDVSKLSKMQIVVRRIYADR